MKPNVILAKAGIQEFRDKRTPAFAGVTAVLFFVLGAGSGAFAQSAPPDMKAMERKFMTFTPAQMRYLTNNDPKNPQSMGAELQAQYFYHYFKPDRDSHLVPPAWVDPMLAAMIRHPVWQDPQEGILNEAQLWQAPASVLYEFFETVKKSFPPEYGGTATDPASLIADYEDSRTRFQMALDRLYRARLGDSLGGRGRAVIATFDATLRQMNAILDALRQNDRQQWVQSVMSIGALSRTAFSILQEPPRGWAPPPEASQAAGVVSASMKVLGALLMFAALWSLGSMNESKIIGYLEEHLKRSRQWAHEFNRQFVQIRVQYLVVVPFLICAFIGLVLWNLTMFLILTVAGAYLGYNTPRWVLAFIRNRRGKRVEAQLMDAMILMSNALKSGLDIVQGFELVSRDLTPPISEEFGLVIKNYQLGTPFERALEGMEERISSRLLSYVIKAIVIQRSVGGNITKIFDRIVENIREEGKLEEKVQSLTAQQRIQSLVVAVMPWLMFVLMFVFQPDVMLKYYSNPVFGPATLLFCFIWQSIGTAVVKKMADIQV